jgi:mRNA interferase MazF
MDPAIGHEIRKTRPAVVVTNDHYNRFNWVVLVVPMPSSDTADYGQIPVLPPEGGLTNPCVTLPDQLRAVDRKRLVKKLGELTPLTMLRISRSLKRVMDLP